MRNIIRSFLIRKILTRHIWWWETHRNYPIRDQVFYFSPIAVNPEARNILAVLTTANAISDAAWTAQSLLRYLPPDTGLLMVIDGDLHGSKIQALKELFPGIQLTSTLTLLEQLRSIAPKVAQLGDYHPLGRKLAAILILQKQYNLIYSDSDVLCFREIPEIVNAISGKSGLYLQDIVGVKTDKTILNKVQILGLKYTQTINTGFLFIPKNSLEVDLAEEIMNDINEPLKSWFCETTVIAVLMQQSQAKPLPKNRYVVSGQRQFYFENDVDYEYIALRHFITPVRHLMYLKGMPRLAQEWQR